MFNLKKRPYNLILLTAIVILITSFFASDEVIDFHFHDTYFILPSAYLFLATTGWLLLFWILYMLTHRFLFSKVLTWAHVIMTALPLVLLIGIWFYSNNYYEGLAGMPRRYYDYNNWEGIVLNNNLTKVVLITFVLTALGFFTFLINLVIGLLKNSSITR